MGIEGIGSSQMNSLPSIDVSLGSFTQKNSDKGSRGSQQNFGSVLANTPTDSLDLSPEAQQQLRKLQARDREVRAHEQAHVAASGGYLQGGINYTYTKGSDNKMYAIGGSVSLDVSPIPGDPEATAQKARTIRAAALAPANPSAQDQSVAAQASAMELQARREAANEKRESAEGAHSDFANSEATGSIRKAEHNSIEETHAYIRPDMAVGIFAQASSSTQSNSVAFTEHGSRRTVSASDSTGFLSPIGLTSALSSTSSSTLSSSGRGFLGLVGEGDSATFAASAEKVHAAYRAQQDRFNTITALAPAGTGISMYV